MANFAILRTAKLSKMGSIAGSGSHNFRERPTANADPSKTGQNQHVGAKSADELVQAVKARLPAKHRSNAVLCVEYMISASPEALAGMNARTQSAFFTDALQWLRARHGAENVVCASVHRDETTPHMVAYVVPLLDGKLNARAFLGGRKALSDMQTDFAGQVGAKYGLQRGLERSKANHKSVKQWYSEQAIAEAAVPPLKPRKLPFTESVIVPEAELGVLVKLASKATNKAEELKRLKDDNERLLQAAKANSHAASHSNAKVRQLSAKLLELKNQANEGFQKMGEQLIQMSEEKKALIKATGNLLKALPKAELAQLVGVELVGKADVFDSLVKSGRAASYAEAVQVVAQAYNQAHETKISESARFVMDYDRAESSNPKGPSL